MEAERRGRWRRAFGIVLAVVAIAAAARIAVPLPLTPVPQSAQTLAVLAAGLLLGSRLAATAVAVYLAVGALGAPVFAGGASGAARLVGPAGGYLAGFVAAAALIGVWHERGRTASYGMALTGALLAHGIILSLGWLRLAVAVGPFAAWASGVRPFLLGALVKSLLAALLGLALARRRAGARTGSTP